MSPRMYIPDAQQALAFVTSQLSYIEPQVIEVQYPEIQYAQLIPVDTTAPEWTKSITFFSSDKVGEAGWFHHYAKDTHYADIERNKFESGVEMADIGYRWTMEEIGQAMQAPNGVNLSADRAIAARRAYEEFVDRVALQGDTDKGYDGFLDYPGVTTIMSPVVSTAAGTGTSFTLKTPDQILDEVNDVLTGQYVDTMQIELADTILLPFRVLLSMANRRLNDLASVSILTYLQQNNVYTFTTGRPLTIRGVRGLEDVGTGGTGRMIAYRRDPQVVKMHIPMPHRFLPVWRTGPLVYDVPGIFRLGGVEIRRLGAVRYLDGVLEEAYE